jgi:hypothetical protein
MANFAAGALAPAAFSFGATIFWGKNMGILLATGGAILALLLLLALS